MRQPRFDAVSLGWSEKILSEPPLSVTVERWPPPWSATPMLDRFPRPHRAAAATAGTRRHRGPDLPRPWTHRYQPRTPRPGPSARRAARRRHPRGAQARPAGPLGPRRAVDRRRPRRPRHQTVPRRPGLRPDRPDRQDVLQHPGHLRRIRGRFAAHPRRNGRRPRQGRLKGRRPKLSTKQQAELRRMHGTGNYTITDLAELFNISRPTVYRTLTAAERVPRKVTAGNTAAQCHAGTASKNRVKTSASGRYRKLHHAPRYFAGWDSLGSPGPVKVVTSVARGSLAWWADAHPKHSVAAQRFSIPHRQVCRARCALRSSHPASVACR